MRFLSIELSKDLYENVTVFLARKHKNLDDIINHDVQQLVDKSPKAIITEFEVPKFITRISFIAFVEARKIVASVTVPADESKKYSWATLSYYMGWLKKNSANDNFFISVIWKNRPQTNRIKFSELRDEENLKQFLTHDTDKNAMPKEFIIEVEKDLAGNFSRKQKFVKETENFLHDFYTQILQNIEDTWKPPVPKEKS